MFFEVAFENGLRFPLHPFMKEVLQHFNACPSQLAPNGWGILVAYWPFFRDRGLSVPNVALLLYLFSPRRPPRASFISPGALELPSVITDLPSSYRSWKGRYFFVSGRNWEYNPFDEDDTLGVRWLGPPLIIFVSVCSVFGITCVKVAEYF